MTPEAAEIAKPHTRRAAPLPARGRLALPRPIPAGDHSVLESTPPGRRPEARAPARRSADLPAVALLGPLAVVLLTPLILIAGLVALIGLAAIVTGRHLRSLTRSPEPTQLADVVYVDSSAGEIPLGRAA